MTVGALTEKLSLKTVAPGDPEREITGCYIGDLLSWVMGKAQAGNAWITIMTNINVVAVAVLADVACVIVPENADIDQATVDKANMQGVALLQSKQPAYETACALSRVL